MLLDDRPPLWLRHVTRKTRLLPGLGLAAGAAAATLLVTHWLPMVSPLLLAIVVGAVLANTVGVAPTLRSGLAVASKRLLRVGVALLGLQLSLADIAGLGWRMIVVVAAIVAGGILTTLALGRLLGVAPGQRLLIACGFSICGAAAVAAVDGVADVDEEEVATSVALVVLFGTLMIPLIPLLAHLVGFTDRQAGLWAGGSIHEVAQVVAAGGLVSGAALSVAVVVKLTRVVMLAPVLAVIAVRSRRSASTRPGMRRPPLVPLFVVMFVLGAVLRTTGSVPDWALDGAHLLQTALLTAAMFALGCGVHLASLRRLGGRPLLLATGSTVVVAALALAGPLLAG